VKSYAKSAAVAEVVAEPAPARPQRVEIPRPPFLGARVAKDFDLRQLFDYINETALFKNQWQLKTASAEDYPRLVQEKFRPILEELKQEVLGAGWFERRRCNDTFLASDGNDRSLRPCGPRGDPALHLPAPEGSGASIPDFRERGSTFGCGGMSAVTGARLEVTHNCSSGRVHPDFYRTA
jgi:hypothetical protein